jgi:hypothetical protein
LRCPSLQRAGMAVRAFPFAVALTLLIATSPAAVGPPAGWRERALSYADSEHMFGSLHQTATGYAGSFVSFQFDELSVSMTDYIVKTPSRSTSVFQTVSPDGAAAGVSGINGSIFHFVSNAMEIAIHNNPTSALSIASKATTINVTFTLSPGMDARRNGRSLNISSPNLAARLFVAGAATLSLSGADATATLPQGTSVTFRANATGGEGAVGALGQQSLGNASVRNLLALESFGVGLEGFIEMSDVEYGGIAALSATVIAEGVQINLRVSSTSSRLFAIHLHESVIPVDNRTQLSLKLDDQVVSQLSTLDEVMECNGAEPCSAHVTGSKGLLLLISLPLQGDHVLRAERVLSAGQQGLNPIQLAAIAAVVLVLLGIAATVMLRRKPPT